MTREEERKMLEIVENLEAIAKILEQEPKTGHWIYTGDYITDGMLKCSECGFEHDVSERFFYCPNCGVKMEKEEGYDRNRIRSQTF